MHKNALRALLVRKLVGRLLRPAFVIMRPSELL